MELLWQLYLWDRQLASSDTGRSFYYFLILIHPSFGYNMANVHVSLLPIRIAGQEVLKTNSKEPT